MQTISVSWFKIVGSCEIDCSNGLFPPGTKPLPENPTAKFYDSEEHFTYKR